MKSQELSFGFDHQLNATMAVGVRYVHKQLDYGIEDMGQLDADQNEIYLIANPGFGIASTVYDVNGNTYTTPAYPKAVRDYDSVEFVLEQAPREQLVAAHELHVEPALRQLLRACRSRTRTAAPARTSAARSTTRS